MAIVFDTHGSGPPLVLLHGIGSRRGVWDPVVGTLARDRRVIALDVPGFGDSPQDGVEPTVAGFAARLERWFAEQGLGRPHVAGNSMGGAIALELGRRGAAASVCAISPAGFWTPRERVYAQSTLRASRALARRIRPAVPAITRTAVGRTALFGQVYGRPWRLSPAESVATIDAFLDAPAFEAAMDAFTDHVFRNGDALRGTPVTVAWGTRDALLIPRQGRRAQRIMPWARHVTLRGCGHVPFHDDPPMVAAAIAA
ncbi:MAG TPA: alpha/beta fold hydrolase [Solirubrobacteraceae bacterium]|jgi:pimeloyl-ACP methyl ester carboxylesterase